MNLGNVLVLEDEPFIALDMEEMLCNLGAASVVCFDTCSEGLKWLESNSADLAVVDPRLNDGLCTAVVEKLGKDKIPFLVYCGAAVDEPAFSKGEQLTKPTMPDILEETLTRLLCPSSGGHF